MSDTESLSQLLNRATAKVSYVAEDLCNYKRAFYITGNLEMGSRLSGLEQELMSLLTLIQEAQEVYCVETNARANQQMLESVESQMDIIKSGNFLSEENVDFVRNLLGIKNAQTV